MVMQRQKRSGIKIYSYKYLNCFFVALSIRIKRVIVSLVARLTFVNCNSTKIMCVYMYVSMCVKNFSLSV